MTDDTPDPSFLSALPARWRARAKELTSGPSLGPSRDLEYEMRAYQLEACAADLSSVLSALPRQESRTTFVAALLHDLRMATSKDDAWAILQDYGRLAEAAAHMQALAEGR